MPAKIDTTCSSTGTGLNCGCFNSSVSRAPSASSRWVEASRSDANCANAAISRYCASESLMPPATCFIARICAAEPTRLTELLKQPQFSPVPVEEQVVSIFAGTRGYLDNVAVAEVGRFESSMLGELRSSNPELLAAIRNEGALSDASQKSLTDFLDNFAKTFA